MFMAISITSKKDDLRPLDKSAQDLDVGRDTLRQEARGLMQLADQLDDSFGAALDVIQKRANGRMSS